MENNFDHEPEKQDSFQNEQLPSGKDSSPLTFGNFLVMFILLLIPIVGVIMTFIWAFGDKNINKNNFGKAVLVLMGIGIILSIVTAVAGIVPPV